MITAIVIAAVAGFISLVSGATSIGTILHFKKKFASLNDEKTKVDVENEIIEKKYVVPTSSFTSDDSGLNSGGMGVIEFDEFTMSKDTKTPNETPLLLTNNGSNHGSLPIAINEERLSTKPHSNSFLKKPNRDNNSSLVSEVIKKQAIRIETHDRHDYFSSESKTETGRHNEVANTLSGGVSHLLTAFTPQSDLQTIVNGIDSGLTTVVNGMKDEKPKDKNSEHKLAVPKTHTRHNSLDIKPSEDDKLSKLSKTPEPKRLTQIKKEEGDITLPQSKIEHKKKLPTSDTDIKKKDNSLTEIKFEPEKKPSFSEQLNKEAKLKIQNVKQEAVMNFSKSIHDNHDNHDNKDTNDSNSTKIIRSEDITIQLAGNNNFSDEGGSEESSN